MLWLIIRFTLSYFSLVIIYCTRGATKGAVGARVLPFWSAAEKKAYPVSTHPFPILLANNYCAVISTWLTAPSDPKLVVSLPVEVSAFVQLSVIVLISNETAAQERIHRYVTFFILECSLLGTPALGH